MLVIGKLALSLQKIAYLKPIYKQDSVMSDFPLISHLAGIRSKQPWLVMNAADKFLLSGSDDQTISHFYSFESRNTEEQTFAIPDGCVDILFDCDESRPSAEVFGTPMEAITIELNKNHRYFGVRFASGVMPDFLNASAGELVGHHYNLLDIVPHANQMFEDIVSSSNFAEQAALFGRFSNNKEIRNTSRTLQRQFRADMGMSPKAFCRIIRCQSAVYDINHGDEVAFSDLACDLGFSDQAHFQREFKKLVNATPLDYLNRVKHETYLKRIQYL